MRYPRKTRKRNAIVANRREAANPKRGLDVDMMTIPPKEIPIIKARTKPNRVEAEKYLSARFSSPTSLFNRTITSYIVPISFYLSYNLYLQATKIPKKEN
jgi:hypothetical protein